MSALKSNSMKVTTTQGDIVINITTVKRHQPSTWFEPVRKVGIRLSGGADSAIVAYMLALYKRDYRPDIVLHAITCVNDNKPYQEIYAKRVMEKITELTGVEFGEHFVKDIDGSDYIGNQRVFVDDLYDRHKLDIHFMGETMNPPVGTEQAEDWFFDGGSRDHSRDNPGDTHTPVVIYRPIRNIDKRGVKELYDHFGVLDTLYPVTRSCEIQLDNRRFTGFDNHCERCWFCLERFWGFGRYV